MANTKYTANQRTKIIRWIARIWSAIMIAFALFMIVSYIWNWVTTGKADPYAMDNYPLIENLIPITLILSIMGLGFAWRWEGFGGTITIVFQLITFAVHHWLLSPRPYPYPLMIIIVIPGILFLVCWWQSRNRMIS